MADTSDLHPAVLHALKTGNVEEALKMAGLDKQSLNATTRPGQADAPKQASRRHQPPVIDDDDDFYARFRSNPLGR